MISEWLELLRLEYFEKCTHKFNQTLLIYFDWVRSKSFGVAKTLKRKTLPGILIDEYCFIFEFRWNMISVVIIITHEPK